MSFDNRRIVTDYMEARAAQNGGSRPPPPPPPPPQPPRTATGDSGDSTPWLQRAMHDVLVEALNSTVDEHRDDIQAANAVLLSRIAVELGVIRAVLLDGLQKGRA